MTAAQDMIAQAKRQDVRWKSDVDLKLDRLCRFADEHEDFLKMLNVRERERAALRRAVIEKSLVALIVAGAIWLVALAWTGFTMEMKAFGQNWRQK